VTYRILLITGWGGGAELLKPLHEALEQKGHSVERLNIFNALDGDILQQHVELAVKYDVIVGWSLGTIGNITGRSDPTSIC